MMPIEFPQANHVYQKPEGWKDEDCSSVSVRRELVMISGETTVKVTQCIKLNAEDLKEIQRTGVIWLDVYGELPPIATYTESPFEERVKFSGKGRVWKHHRREYNSDGTIKEFRGAGYGATCFLKKEAMFAYMEVEGSNDWYWGEIELNNGEEFIRNFPNPDMITLLADVTSKEVFKMYCPGWANIRPVTVEEIKALSAEEVERIDWYLKMVGLAYVGEYYGELRVVPPENVVKKTDKDGNITYQFIKDL